MTEAEWLTCTDPEPMLEFLSRQRSPPKVTVRKMLLFASACCRRIWNVLPTDPCRKGVEIAERYADGLATDQELASAWSAVWASAEEEIEGFGDSYCADSIGWGLIPGGSAFCAITGLLGEGKVEPAPVASNAAAEVAWDVSRMCNGKEASQLAFEAAYTAERTGQALVLRDLYHRPCCSVIRDPAWLHWNNGTIPKLARATYEQGELPTGLLDKDRLRILADALEEAGCADADLLGHLRGPGPHVRGCFVVDALLGKS
jgi:hypothetical protein